MGVVSPIEPGSGKQSDPRAPRDASVMASVGAGLVRGAPRRFEPPDGHVHPIQHALLPRSVHVERREGGVPPAPQQATCFRGALTATHDEDARVEIVGLVPVIARGKQQPAIVGERFVFPLVLRAGEPVVDAERTIGDNGVRVHVEDGRARAPAYAVQQRHGYRWYLAPRRSSAPVARMGTSVLFELREAEAVAVANAVEAVDARQ